MMPTIQTSYSSSDTTITITIPQTCVSIKDIHISLDHGAITTKFCEQKETSESTNLNLQRNMPAVSRKLLGNAEEITRELNHIISDKLDFAITNGLSYSFNLLANDTCTGVRCSEMKRGLINEVLLSTKESKNEPYIECMFWDTETVFTVVNAEGVRVKSYAIIFRKRNSF